MIIPKFLFILSLCEHKVFAFSPNPQLHTFAKTSSTALNAKGVDFDDEYEKQSLIKGIRQDEIILDAGEGGVSFVEDTAVRCSGMVIRNKENELDAECLLLDHFKKVNYIDGNLPPNVNIVATGLGANSYQKKSSRSYSFTDFATDQEIEFAPIEACKAVLRSIDKEKSYERLVINILGGNDLILFQAINATEIIANKLNNVNEIIFNSLSFKDFSEERASIVCVGMEKLPYREYDTFEKEDSLEVNQNDNEEKALRLLHSLKSSLSNQLPPSEREKILEQFKLEQSPDAQKISGVAAGEIYIYEGKYLTLADTNIVKYTDSDTKSSYFRALMRTEEFKEMQANEGKGIDFDASFDVYEAVEYLQEEKNKRSYTVDQENLLKILFEITDEETTPEVIAKRREYLTRNYRKEELTEWGYSENFIDIDKAAEKGIDLGILVDEEEYEEDMSKFMKSLETVFGVEIKDEEALLKLGKNLDDMRDAILTDLPKDKEDDSLFKKLNKDDDAALKQFPSLAELFKKMENSAK